MTSSNRASGADIETRWGLAARIAVGVVLAYGLARVIQDAWVCDDAFISFRYAQNLVRGHGLVYNVGEAVEGYSNFLWTILIALGMRLCADPVLLSQALGVICYAATILLLLRTTRRWAPPGATFAAAVPLAALALSLHAHFGMFATGGLETSLFTLEMTALAVLTINAKGARDYVAIGLVGSAAALTRPDGALFYAIAAGVAACDAIRARRPAFAAAVLLPGLATCVPHFLWRLSYYGYPFPNTFYAKAADEPNIARGLHYMWLYLRCYWILIPALASVLVPFVRGRIGRAQAVLAALVLGSLAFVVWTGGDFMFARFLIPVTPLLYLSLELLLRGVRGPGRRLTLTGAVLAATVVTWYPREITNLLNDSGVVEERAFYPDGQVADARRVGGRLKEVLAGTDARVAIVGMQAMLAYYAEFPLVIESEAGLTDAHLAHLPRGQRFRIGHEKRAPISYLWERGVDLTFVWPPDIMQSQSVFFTVDFGCVKAQGVSYRRHIVEHLMRQPGVSVQDPGALLRGCIDNLGSMPPDELLRQYRFWKAAYLAHNADPETEAAFRRAMAAAGVMPES